MEPGKYKYKQGDLVLVGGWAVHSYIPWKYSLDMDFIATSLFFFTTLSLIGLLATIFLGIETKGKSLEEINREEEHPEILVMAEPE